MNSGEIDREASRSRKAGIAAIFLIPTATYVVLRYQQAARTQDRADREEQGRRSWAEIQAQKNTDTDPFFKASRAVAEAAIRDV